MYGLHILSKSDLELIIFEVLSIIYYLDSKLILSIVRSSNSDTSKLLWIFA